MKQTEIGLIPEDWEVKSISEIADIKTGPFGSSLHEKDYVLDGTPIITVEHLGEMGITYNNLPKVSEVDRKRLNTYSLQVDDIVFSRVGSVDRNAIVSEFEAGWLFSGRLLRIRIQDKNINAKCLSYYFHQEIFKQRVRSVAVGQTMASLNTKIVSSLKFALPTLKEQQAIADILKDTDNYIESLEKLIAKKLFLKQGAMQTLLAPKPGWEIKKWREVAPLQRGFDLPNQDLQLGPYPVVYSNGINNFHIKYLVKGPGVVTGRSGTIGKVNYVENDFWPHNTTLWVTNFNGNNAKFIYYSFLKIDIKNYSTGSGVPTLNRNDLHDFDLSIPPLTEQVRIATILSDIDSEVKIIEDKVKKAYLLKQGIMQHLLTGRIRLANSENQNINTTPQKHNEHFEDAVLIGVLAHYFGTPNFPLTRFKYTKVSYLLKRYKKHQAKGYLKKAAGPYNPQTRYGGAEKIALTKDYVTTHKASYKGKEFEGFVPGSNIAEALHYFNEWYGGDSITWLEQFKFEKNDHLELWATVDMAVEELKDERKVINVASIKQVLQANKEWQAKLTRPIFSDDNIRKAIIKLDTLFD